MLVTFKTITQQAFKYELKPSTTIADAKKKICEENGEASYAVESQKLIYNGKILQDEETLEQIGFDEKKFIVVMVSKKKAEAAAPAASSSSAAESSTASSTTATAKVAAAEPTKTSQPSSPAAPAPSTALEVPAEHLETVNLIQGMGYPRDEVIRALKSAFYDADRCVEYLCTGIPENLMADFAPVEGQLEDEDEDDEIGFNLEFLQNSPQFQQIRNLVRTNPETLPQIVQQIASTNPALMEMIRSNQDAFLQLLNSEPSDVGAPAAGGGGAGSGGASAAGGAAGGQNTPPGAVTIAISESDRDAIQRLKALGFAEQLVIEAYFACDKNEDLAANYILARMDEFHDQFNNADS